MSTGISRGPNVCPSCGEENSPTVAYCRLCGAALGAAIQKTPPPAQAPFHFPIAGTRALKHNRMQRLYETGFAAGLLVMPFCIGLAFLFCLGGLPMSPTLLSAIVGRSGRSFLCGLFDAALPVAVVAAALAAVHKPL